MSRWPTTEVEAYQIATGGPCPDDCARSNGWHRRWGLALCHASRARHALSHHTVQRDEAVRVPAGYVSRAVVWNPGTSILVPEIDPL